MEGFNAETAGAIADDVRFRVDRDDDTDIIDIPIQALNFTNNLDVRSFIVASSELRFKVVAGNASTADIRFTVSRIKLTDILRARFGLAGREDLPS